MWLNNLTMVMAEDDGSGLYRLLPILIISALYALSGLLKKKEQQKKQQQKRPAPKSQRREETLPTYARRKPQQPVGTAAPRSKPAPRTPQPGPGRKPTSSAPRPRPVPSRRPAAETPVPIEIIPEPIARRPKPIPIPSAQRKKPAKAPKTAARPAELAHTRDRIKAKQQMPQVVKVVESKIPSRRKEKSSTTARKDLAADRLDLALGQKNVLVRAIVYAEILGKPIGLKPKGGYELE